MSSDGRFRVLVVCTGNICRSPMGERILRHELAHALGPGASRIIVSSAGTYSGHAGEPMQPGAAAVMAERGIDADDFRATALTEALIENHDLILTAERSHRADVVRLSPVATHRTFTLVELSRLVAAAGPRSAAESDPADALRSLVARAAASRGTVPPPDDPAHDDIDDPYGMPVDDFRRCAARIDSSLAPLVQGILSES